MEKKQEKTNFLFLYFKYFVSQYFLPKYYFEWLQF